MELLRQSKQLLKNLPWAALPTITQACIETHNLVPPDTENAQSAILVVEQRPEADCHVSSDYLISAVNIDQGQLNFPEFTLDSTKNNDLHVLFYEKPLSDLGLKPGFQKVCRRQRGVRLPQATYLARLASNTDQWLDRLEKQQPGNRIPDTELTEACPVYEVTQEVLLGATTVSTLPPSAFAVKLNETSALVAFRDGPVYELSNDGRQEIDQAELTGPCEPTGLCEYEESDDPVTILAGAIADDGELWIVTEGNTLFRGQRGQMKATGIGGLTHPIAGFAALESTPATAAVDSSLFLLANLENGSEPDLFARLTNNRWQISTNRQIHAAGDFLQLGPISNFEEMAFVSNGTLNTLDRRLEARPDATVFATSMIMDSLLLGTSTGEIYAKSETFAPWQLDELRQLTSSVSLIKNTTDGTIIGSADGHILRIAENQNCVFSLAASQKSEGSLIVRDIVSLNQAFVVIVQDGEEIKAAFVQIHRERPRPCDFGVTVTQPNLTFQHACTEKQP